MNFDVGNIAAKYVPKFEEFKSNFQQAKITIYIIFLCFL